MYGGANPIGGLETIPKELVDVSDFYMVTNIKSKAELKYSKYRNKAGGIGIMSLLELFCKHATAVVWEHLSMVCITSY